MDQKPSWCDAHERISNARQRALTREQLRRWLERYLKRATETRVTGVQGIAYTTGASAAMEAAVRIHVKGTRLGPWRVQGRFTISGAISDRGRFTDFGAHQGGWKIVRHLYGAKGTIRITLRHGGPDWTITKGTKAYAELRGSGSEEGHDTDHARGTVDYTMEGTVTQ
jgi:hypothetical protein